MTDEKKSTAIAVRESAPVGRRGIVINDIDTLQRFCKAMVASRYFKSAQDVAQAMVKVQYGMELGLPPIAAMQGVYVVDGKLSLSALTIGGLIKASGRYTYRGAVDDNAARIEFFERDKRIGEASFSMADAERAGLSSKDVWKRYRRAMLWARALSQGARWFCPDVFNGPVYTPEEIGSGGDHGEVDYIDSEATAAPEPESTTTQSPASDALRQALQHLPRDIDEREAYLAKRREVGTLTGDEMNILTALSQAEDCAESGRPVGADIDAVALGAAYSILDDADEKAGATP